LMTELCPRWESNHTGGGLSSRALCRLGYGDVGSDSLPITLCDATPAGRCREQPRLGELGHVAENRAPEQRPRVLIAEDEALIRLDLAEMLVEEGYGRRRRGR